ncbi:MAG: PlsC protein [Gammaproteobacteria bacterium]|nr:PlsC protein [Gammaproteobacteria bacterium]
MKTIQEALQNAKLGPEYSYLLDPPSLPGRFIKRLFELFCKAVFMSYCPLQVTGRENIPATSFIFCSNHSSHMDSSVLMAASGLPYRRFRKTNHIALVQSLASCREFVRNGNRNIIIYPEGTRSLTGQMANFKKGPAMIATELGIPIVPAYIDGTFAAMRKGSKFIKPHQIRVHIGEAINPRTYTDQADTGTHKHIYDQITEDLERSIRQLLQQSSTPGLEN